MTKQMVASEGAVLVTCPPERHIPVDFAEIYALVRGSMSIAQREKFEAVCQLIESLYAQEFMVLRRNLKRNFLAFSVGAKGQLLQTRTGKGLPPKADLDMKELKLIADFIQLMAAARFHILTKEEWDLALAESFMFTLPVEVNWGYFDSKMLNTFWQSTGERRRLRRLLPDVADKVLVFHRGVGVAEDSGLYINQKIDLLLEYLVVEPTKKAWNWIKSRIPRGKKAAAAADAAAGAAPGGAAGTASPAAAAAAAPQAAAGGGIGGDDESNPLLHRNAKVVERKTLARMMPTAWSVIKTMPRTLKIQEPMFKEVVVVYRTSGGGRKRAAAGPVRARDHATRLKDILSRRNIHIKCFHDIPMADVEAIFPDKKVFLKTLSIINMIIQAVTAFFAVIATLWKAGDKVDLSVVWSALSLVAARVGQMYSSMQAERSQMIQDMVNILYDKTNDSQEGVVSMLLEDMAEQQLKEAVLAYSLLYANIEDELSQEALDTLCEDFLDTNFALKLDFAVEDALPRLLEWGLVNQNPKNGNYQAVSVEIAHKQLYHKWVQAYEALSRPAALKSLPLASLLSTPGQMPANSSPPLTTHPSLTSLVATAGTLATAAAAVPAPAAAYASSTGGSAAATPAASPAMARPPMQQQRSPGMAMAGDDRAPRGVLPSAAGAGAGAATPARSTASAVSPGHVHSQQGTPTVFGAGMRRAASAPTSPAVDSAGGGAATGSPPVPKKSKLSSLFRRKPRSLRD